MILKVVKWLSLIGICSTDAEDTNSFENLVRRGQRTLPSFHTLAELDGLSFFDECLPKLQELWNKV